MRTITLYMENVSISGGMRLECEMTHEQKVAAIGALVDSMSGSEWDSLVRDIAAEQITESYQEGREAGLAQAEENAQ